MNPSYEDNKAKPSKAQSTAQAADWNEHEHVSQQVQREAQRLVDEAGSPGIAKMAIEVIEHQQEKPHSKVIDPPAPSSD